jgi:ATP-dependent exoDNAse (exonuclease V) alpha subunit
VVVGEDPLPLSEAARFQLFKPGEIALAKGDLIRITRNGKSKDGKHALNNGATFTVKGFTRSGDIVLANGWTVAKHFGHLTHGYVVTSYASQGKSVDRVFIGQSSQSFPASSREQFYVSASRGELQATIFTDDKEALLEAVDNSDERLSATELVNGRAITLSRLALLAPELESASRDRHREAVYER